MSNFITLMDQLMDDSFFQPTNAIRRRVSAVPALNVSEESDRYVVTLAASGISPEKVEVEVHENTLTIRYEDEKTEQKETKMLRQEYVEYTSFTRSLALPKNVDADKIEADYKKGILTILVSKLPEAQPKKVQVKTSE